MKKKLEPPIGGFLKNSFIDYPGKIASVIFLQGCNFRCPYCHNPDLVLPELFSKPIDEASVFSFLEERKGKLDGVVVSGGEALIYRHLIPFLKQIKDLGYLVKLDTNGSFPDRLSNILESGLVDFVSLDLKSGKEAHSKFTGSHFSLDQVLDSLKLLKQWGGGYEVRITCLSRLKEEQDVESLVHLLSDCPSVVLQGFRPSKCLDKSYDLHPAFSTQELEKLKEYFEKYSQNVSIR